MLKFVSLRRDVVVFLISNRTISTQVGGTLKLSRYEGFEEPMKFAFIDYLKKITCMRWILIGSVAMNGRERGTSIRDKISPPLPSPHLGAFIM